MQKLIAWVRANGREVAIDSAAACGVGCIVYGMAQVYAPAGWIVGGCFAIAGAYLAANA